jgi:hypothetical protein
VTESRGRVWTGPIISDRKVSDHIPNNVACLQTIMTTTIKMEGSHHFNSTAKAPLPTERERYEVIERSVTDPTIDQVKSDISFGCFQRIVFDPSHHVSDIGTGLVICWGKSCLTTE